MSRFATPLTKTLVLSQPNGQPFPDTLLVRQRLTAGEAREIFTRMYRAAGKDASRETVLALYPRSLVVAYLLDWSVLDDQGQKVAIAGASADSLEAILDALEPDDFTEMHRAIETHVAEMTAAREAEKNGQDGGNKLPVTSPSPSAVTGAMSGSAIWIPT